MIVNKRQSKNDMDEDFEEYVEDEYDDFEVEPPMHEIKDERDRTFTRRGFEKKTVDFSKQHSGFGKKKGLPAREKSGPMNRTRGRSPFTYSRGLQLHRKRSEVEDCDCEERPKRKSWGVPWK